MCVCREVRFSTILLFGIAVLLGGIGASRTEAAGCLSACTGPTTGSFLYSHADVLECVPPVTGPVGRLRANLWGCPTPAMAILDGPGAVCFGVMGFLCVTLVRNRRMWISLCLFVLTSGRADAARMSSSGVPAIDPQDEGETSDSLLERMPSARDWRFSISYPVLHSPIPGIRGCRLLAQPASLVCLRDGHLLKGLLSIGVGGEGPAKCRLIRVRASVVVWPMSNEYGEWARPPPARSLRAIWMKWSYPRISVYWHDEGEEEDEAVFGSGIDLRRDGDVGAGDEHILTSDR